MSVDDIFSDTLIAPAARPSQPARHYICLYMPFLSVHRLSRLKGWSADKQIIALYKKHKNAEQLVSLSEPARKAGLYSGMAVADARARCPDLKLAEYDAAGDHMLLERLARWAWRYSPRTGIDARTSMIWIDATGASHLYGGIEKMITDIKSRYHQAGLGVCCAAAPYYAAAQALCCYHPQAEKYVSGLSGRAGLWQMLSVLPVAALRIAPDISEGLLRSGLRKIGDLQPFSQTELAVRFGPDFVHRWAVLRGHIDERPVPIEPIRPLLVSHAFAEPLIGYDGLSLMIRQLIQELSTQLYQAELSARQFELGWKHADGRTGRLYFHLARPARSQAVLERLFDQAAMQIDAEFGIDYSWLQAHQLSTEKPVTALLGTDTDRLHSQHIDRVLDILSVKLGPDRVSHAIFRPFWHIDDSLSYQPAAFAQTHTQSWPGPTCFGLHAPRPVRLIEPAEQADVIAMLPDHPPAQIRWRHHHWKISRATGPERIGPRWWDRAHSTVKSRDYYRVETQAGTRLWIYREGLVERGETARWFVQGYFA